MPNGSGLKPLELPLGPWSGLTPEMTQAELASRLGVTRQTVIAIEQGKYSPSLEMAFGISRLFGVPLEQVFQYDEMKDGKP